LKNAFFSIKKVADIYGDSSLIPEIKRLERSGEIPPSKRFRSGALFKKGWHLRDLPQIGEKIGFFNKFDRALSLAVFTTKGGVLKSTLALNIARTAALHNINTCVVGLDIQGDITTTLGFENQFEDDEDLSKLIDKLNSTKGLSDLFNGQARLEEIIVSTDLPGLFLIPETPELVAMNDSLSTINRREFWIKEKVIENLKKNFDLIIMDCSPNWNKLTTNALVACDVLISPLECKINNFRNFKVFRHFLSEFKKDMRMDFETVFIPTRYNNNRRLGLEIKKWYEKNVRGCTSHGVKESVSGEEAIALYRSLIEHVPGKSNAYEMRLLLKEINKRIQENVLCEKEPKHKSYDDFSVSYTGK
jgi:chromosome partitioning protein